MEAVKETLTYQEDTGLYRKLLPGDYTDNDKCKLEEEISTESNYVDLDALLDMKSEATKTVKVTFTGEGNQLAVFKCNSDTSGDKSPGGPEVDDNVDRIYPEDEGHSPGHRTHGPAADERALETSSPTSDVPNTNVDFENGNITQVQPEAELRGHNNGSDSEELQYTDMYMDSKSDSEEEDDVESVVMSEHRGPDTLEDESHYITTHEIQLTELDHDVDYDLGRGTRWDFEDDNLVYSFVDYASLESGATAEGTLIVEGRGQAKVKCGNKAQCNAHQRAGGPLVSTEQESDPCDSDKCASSDESVCKNRGGNPPGQIHLSIKTSSKAINESNSIPENDNICYHTKHLGDKSHFFFTSTDARAEAICDRTRYFIPAPGRQHLATKLRGKGINEYSSGASSSISELDDADKEVRNLTAKSFRSLACPYLDAINLSTSSESSMSEYGLGLNKWSAYVDLKNRNVKAQCNNKKASQTRMYALNRKMSSSQQASSSTKKIELKGQSGQEEVITLTETLNFRCNVAAGLPERVRRPKSSENVRGLRSRDEVPGTAPAKQGCEANYQHSDAGDGMEDTHKKAIFASSLLKNVISKKMQFEHERKMERGELRDTYPTHSPSFQGMDLDRVRERGLGGRRLHRQSSETSSGFTADSSEDPGSGQSRPSSCDTTEERSGQTQTKATGSAQPQPQLQPQPQPQPTTEAAADEKKEAAGDTSRGPLSRSQNSAFTSWRDGEPQPPSQPGADGAGGPPKIKVITETKLDPVGSKLTKLSHLFVPSSQLLPKDKESREPLTDGAPATGASGDLRKSGSDTLTHTGGNGFGGKVPEIKICLRSVKDNKGYPLNIANFLTPKVGYNAANMIKTAGDTKLQVLTALDKVPHFTVRDIRDNKCKFQTPIYQVRDVRKLVKSSYRVVSLDNSENRPQVNPPVAAETRGGNEGSEKELEKTPTPSPIVIKCQSVKVPLEPTTKNETASPHRTASRLAPVFPKQPNPDQAELHAAGERKPESKIPKQAALEKLKAAVKTMEQLYVFDRNEWKRKTQAPRPVTDSHVLSLITREEQSGPAKTETEEDPGGAAAGSGDRLINDHGGGDFSHTLLTKALRDTHEDGGALRIIHVPYSEDTFRTQAQHGRTFSNKSVLHLGGSGGDRTTCSASSHNESLQSGSQTSQTSSVLRSVASKAPMSFQISPLRKTAAVDRVRLLRSPTDVSAQPPPTKLTNPDSENYLTIPVEGYVGKIKFPNQEHLLSTRVSQKSADGASKRHERSTQPRRRSPPLVVSETRSSPLDDLPRPATIYHHHPHHHHPSSPSSQPQVYCFTPGAPTLSPPPACAEAYPQTQKKVLLDPATGQCFLVDTPVQPVTRRLFDPETGQFVDVPVPMPAQPPAVVGPIAAPSPVPMSVSPLALSPAAFAPTYMIYPGFIPSPTFPAAPAQDGGGGVGTVLQGKYPASRSGLEANPPYYSATGGSIPVLGRVNAAGTAASTDGKPVISITTQQGPRIIAPPSFDGTTMSFVVEHR